MNNSWTAAGGETLRIFIIIHVRVHISNDVTNNTPFEETENSSNLTLERLQQSGTHEETNSRLNLGRGNCYCTKKCILCQLSRKERLKYTLNFPLSGMWSLRVARETSVQFQKDMFLLYLLRGNFHNLHSKFTVERFRVYVL
jgi:hypothetical protein